MSGHYFSPYVEWLATTLQDMLTPILCGFFYKVVYTQALAEVDRIHKNSTNPNGRKLETCSQEFDEVFYPQALLPLLEQVKNGAPCFDSIIQDIHNSIERQYRQLLPMLKEIYGVTVNEFL